jgi:hypothetical protein
MSPCKIKEPVEYQRSMLNEIERAKSILLKAGYGVIDPPYLNLLRAGRMSLASFGLKVPRPMTLIIKLVGLSPGTITLWHDAESGFFTEARAKEGAPPVYRHVTDEVAIKILKGELTHELEVELMTPDDYIGE